MTFTYRDQFSKQSVLLFPINLFDSAFSGHLFRFFADITVEFLAEVILCKVISYSFAAFFSSNDILATVCFFERAFSAFPLTFDSYFFPFRCQRKYSPE